MKAEQVNMNTMFFKCQSTEMLFYHAGQPMSIYMVTKNDVKDTKDLERVILGPNPDLGHVLCFPVPSDTWFTRLVETGGDQDYTLFSCCLAPGFDQLDFQAKVLYEVLIQ